MTPLLQAPEWLSVVSQLWTVTRVSLGVLTIILSALTVWRMRMLPVSIGRRFLSFFIAGVGISATLGVVNYLVFQLNGQQVSLAVIALGFLSQISSTTAMMVFFSYLMSLIASPPEVVSPPLPIEE